MAALLSLCAPSLSLAQAEGPSLALGGDVLYDGPLEVQLQWRARAVGRARALEEVFADLAPSLQAADLAIVNLEVPVSPRYREREEEVPVFAAPDDFLDALRAAGVDALTVANNHAYDQGVRGLESTLRAAARRQLAIAGAGDDASSAARAILVEREGARVALAAWTEGSNHRPRAREGSAPRIAFLRDGTLAESLRAARAEAHLVIASFHWTESVRPEGMRALVEEAAEAGADLIVGHGTHVPGRTEVLVTSEGRRVHVLYSLGNLLAAMDEPAGTLESRDVGVRDAPLAMVRTRWRGERLEITSVDVRHHWITRPVSAPWIEGGRIPVSRPVAIDAALARIERARCGAPCAARASDYGRRAALMRRAMRPITPGDELDLAPPIPELARRPSAPIAGPDPRLASYAGGVSIEASFPGESPREARIDEPAIARIAALMREDRSLRCEVSVTAATAALALRRAHRVKGLIAVRGPSRARFELRAGAGDDAVRVRLFR